MAAPNTALAASGETGAGSDGTTKFCVVVAPFLRDVTLNPAHVEEGAVRSLLKVSGRSESGFFAGTMRKIGFGTPASFVISKRRSLKFRSGEAFHADSTDIMEIERRNHDQSSFFPSAGFFTKTSSDGKKGVAFGAGLSSTSSSIWERESSGPCGKVSLMFGFGF